MVQVAMRDHDQTDVLGADTGLLGLGDDRARAARGPGIDHQCSGVATQEIAIGLVHCDPLYLHLSLPQDQVVLFYHRSAGMQLNPES